MKTYLFLLLPLLLGTACTSERSRTEKLISTLSSPAICGGGIQERNAANMKRLAADCRADGMSEKEIRGFLLAEPLEAALYEPQK